MMSIYPENWPRCPSCGDFALDGHITCGRAGCNERGQRIVKKPLDRPKLLSFACIEGEHDKCPGHCGSPIINCECYCHEHIVQVPQNGGA